MCCAEFDGVLNVMDRGGHNSVYGDAALATRDSARSVNIAGFVSWGVSLPIELHIRRWEGEISVNYGAVMVSPDFLPG